ncbi:MAG: type II toxin-antitoxin system RelE/ParE family toxin [Gemmatimonadota bacterium]
MASYELRIKPSAVKELETLPLQERRRVVDKIQGLSEECRPHGCEKLTGHDRYRLRQGVLRILYEVDDDARTVTVVKIGHRSDVYR